MNMMAAFQGPASSKARMPIYTIAALGGQRSGMVACHDAGDDASYSSGQTWTDRTGTTDLYRGSGSGADGADPTFNGTAGRNSSSEYFSHDGGDYYTATGSPAWVQTLHKDNALFTLLWLVYLNSTVSYNGMFGTLAVGVGHGVAVDINPDGTFGFQADKAGVSVLSLTSSASISEDVWHQVAIALDEAGNSSRIQIDNTFEAKTGAYTAPTSSASSTLKLANDTIDPAVMLESGARMNGFVAWTRALSQAELMWLWAMGRGKLGF